MPVIFDPTCQTFKLDAGNTSYVIHIQEGGYLVNLYYGPYIPDTDLRCYYPTTLWVPSFHPRREALGPHFSMDTAPMEYSGFGTGDFRRTAIRIRSHEGNTATDPRYVSHKIYNGKPSLDGLPATWVSDDRQAQTLEILTRDAVTGAEVTLLYTVFAEHPVITKSVRVKNSGSHPFVIEDLMSCVVNLPSMDYSAVSLYGKHLAERAAQAHPLTRGTFSVSSRRGASGHEYNPFLALARHGSREEHGETYGFHFVYSGSFTMEAACDYYENTRVCVGMNPEQFSWTLVPGDTFQAPETVLVYTDGGIGEMSRIYHRFYNRHLLRGRYMQEKRPLLINSWEAAFFDFDEEKLYRFALQAKDLGIEMLVMDDGWFGHRDKDNSSLGDWYVYESKIDLGRLVERIHGLGMKFGIWYEPEMISQDSDLFRAHPDWCLHVPGRDHCQCRDQYVLDMSRPEVVDNIFRQMEGVLSQYPIDYLKWDFNRNLTEVGSAALCPDRHGELYHRFMLGTYDLMGRIVDAHPDLLLENCSGGGGRFDPGMLYYSPQIWCSDETDPIERLSIQFGTSLCYPTATMGAHVSANPRTGFATKANVAMWGTFGYELDPTRLSDADRDEIRREIALYHKYYWLNRNGDLYRLIWPQENKFRCAWSVVSPDKREALVTVVVMRKVANTKFYLPLRGLDPQKRYRVDGTELVLSGALLMSQGLNFSQMPHGDHDSYQVYLTCTD